MKDITPSDVLKQILLNQREILNALSIVITPMCKGSMNDTNGQTRCNNSLIKRFHETEQILGLDWGANVPFNDRRKDN